MIKRPLKLILYFIPAIFAGAVLFYLITWYGFQKERADVEFGVTFSTVMVRQLGLNPQTVFDAIIDDLGVKKIRLPVYWTDVELENGKYDFGYYDYFVSKAESSGAELILAVGRKLPRWPECFVPEWAYEMESGVRNEELGDYIKAVVERYRNSPALEIWQVENEPFHTFGSWCARVKFDSSSVEQEIALIRSLDAHRFVMLTDSGEQGIWSSSLSRADLVGVTMYRQVWNETFGVVRFPFGPGFYSIKRELFEKLFPDKKIVVAELQAEPWGPGKLLPDYEISIQKELMNVDRFQSNISYARQTGFDTFYLWGVEWWYWLKEEQGDPSLWEEARRLF